MDGDSELSMFKPLKGDMDDGLSSLSGKGKNDNLKVCISIWFITAQV
jgi:hypothetical protein